MDLEDNGDGLPGRRQAHRKRDNMSENTKTSLLKKATKAGPQLPKNLKVKCMIKDRVKMAQKRKFKELALKKYTKDKSLQNRCSDKLKLKRKVMLVEPSLKSIRPKMLARRPTPLPYPRKRKGNRSKTLPKFVPLFQKKNDIGNQKSSEE
ncbi:uncharacterized protein LOC113564256 [Drosophila erecta]|uniref:uncharacterized protein LOC113564256 n=1 Tax=Drosophila erecta TaxID=7220 RepID=UPI000F0724A1|nr:uncharacterized protein LOC113564256 [Drosophila erecta]